MYHKIIGGKKSKGQRNIKKSIEYLLREKNPEQQKDIKMADAIPWEVFEKNIPACSKERMAV